MVFREKEGFTKIYLPRLYLVAVCVVLLMAVLVVPAMGTMGSAMTDTDLYGPNIASKDVASGTAGITDCISWCDSTSNCVGATWVKPGVQSTTNAKCWIKSQVSSTSSNSNTISYVKMVPVTSVGFNHDTASGNAPLTVLFTPVVTSSLPVTACSWDFGDGSPRQQGACAPVSHTYVNAGSFDVELSVTSLCGLTASKTVPGFETVTTVACLKKIGWKADFSAMPTTGTGSTAVSFTDTSSTGASDWYWSFGDPCTNGCADGGVSTQQNPVHTYKATGTYDVELIVKDNCGTTYKEKKTSFITITDSTGAIDIMSSPSGATVTIDGTNVGTTPLLGKDLPAGTHNIVLTLSGYQDYSTTVNIYKGIYSKLSPILTKSSSPATGFLQIITTPAGAVVYVDGGSQGTTPTTISGLSASSHTVKLTKTGYADYQGTVTVQAGKTTPLTISLVTGTGSTSTTTTSTTSQTGTGSVSIVSSPAGASVNLDGWDKGTTPVTIPQVKAGSHTLTVKKTGYGDVVKTIDVTAGYTTSLTVSLTQEGQPPFGSGTLTVHSTPAGATVYLDGDPIGITPVKIENVKAGTHKLLLTMQNYGDYTQTAEIASGSDKEISVDLSTAKKAPGFAIPISLAALAFVSLVLFGRRKDQ